MQHHSAHKTPVRMGQKCDKKSNLIDKLIREAKKKEKTIFSTPRQPDPQRPEPGPLPSQLHLAFD